LTREALLTTSDLPLSSAPVLR
jgi:hypothetical protein